MKLQRVDILAACLAGALIAAVACGFARSIQGQDICTTDTNCEEQHDGGGK